ncbi:2-oxoglutarate and iron-dependent oxygenase domain-containing protein [Haliangium sp. UPWRP_2]|uniref:2-oxoglutarate and iron-dependent oxygenase domain-containing protein n=1 Tax=Haliangium sp. UPWRP_2 TaxID=1931276 RepID=UPI001304DCA7|nr:2-oxoglutarate and iron-dependent oxygenase domain-containing protein [Haliangium sp. UPWRP_2]
MHDIPLIDFTPVHSGGATGEREVARQIDRACREVGFFTLHSHGIARAVFSDVNSALKQFFVLPAADKMACRLSTGATMSASDYTPYGYSALLEENAFAYMGEPDKPSDYVEKFSTGRLILDDQQPLPFPTGAHGQYLRRTLKAYYQACESLAARLSELLALSLGYPRSFFTERIDRSDDSLRAHLYPSASSELANDQGMGEHTDGTLITLLSHTAAGIQVRTRCGEWITPRFHDIDHFIVNIGDLLAHWTRQEYVSTRHRVVLTDCERQSIVFFKLTNEDELVHIGNRQMDALFRRD